MTFRTQRIRDPLHNLIEFRANEFEHVIWNVIQTPPFQRLRRVKQLGFSEFVYPGATHSRFAHSVGVFHTARMLMQIIQRHLGGERFHETQAKQALAAALVHDVGHGPFSHAFEDVGKRLKLPLADHEGISDRLIRDSEITEQLNGIMGSGFAVDVANVIKRGPGSIYSAVVSSQFDADRLDYMRRDRLMTGTQHGAIDFEWLVANLEVGTVPYGVDEEKVGDVDTFVLGPKAFHAAETYVLGLFQLYPTVYLHKATRGAEKLFGELLYRTVMLARDDAWEITGLPRQHPLIAFAKEPDQLGRILALDDTVVWGALGQLTESSDPILRDLSNRLLQRRLYKCIDVREKLSEQFGGDEAAIEAAIVEIQDKIVDWLQSQAAPRIISDKSRRAPYAKLQESKGPLNQILIKTSGGELIDLIKRSKVVEATQTFSLYRVYVDSDETKRFVDDAVAGVSHGAGK